MPAPDWFTRWICIFGCLGSITLLAAEPAIVPQDSSDSTMKQVIIGVLILTSIASLFLIVERAIALRSETVIPIAIKESQNICRTQEDLAALRLKCNEHPSAYGRLLGSCIDHLHLSRAENSEITQTKARAEVVELERGVVVLEIVTGVAPLLGLVGTIFGLITLFKGMGVEVSQEQTAMFSEGISIALQATLLGLVVAIPSLVGWSYFSRRIETLVVEMENQCDQFLRNKYNSQGEGE